MTLTPPSTLKLYHGTDYASLINIIDNGIDLTLCSEFTDFGRGLYATTNLDQAKNWGKIRAGNRKKGNSSSANPAAVLEFVVSLDWLASLETLAFVRDNPATGYLKFVSYCRSGASPHRGNTNFDVVYGPVALWQRGIDYTDSSLFTINDCDQISFHNDKIMRSDSELFSNRSIAWKA